MTVLEVEMRAHLQSSERIHGELQALTAKLDERADKSDVAFARLLGKLAAAVSLAIVAANLLAPVILKAVGFKS